ncbi:hypothetical protein [Streptomyces sp. NPDC002537]
MRLTGQCRPAAWIVDHHLEDLSQSARPDDAEHIALIMWAVGYAVARDTDGLAQTLLEIGTACDAEGTLRSVPRGRRCRARSATEELRRPAARWRLAFRHGSRPPWGRRQPVRPVVHRVVRHDDHETCRALHETPLQAGEDDCTASVTALLVRTSLYARHSLGLDDAAA